MMPRKPEGDKRKRVNVLISPNERKIIAEKMEKYGYSDLSAYLRDAAIYERLFVEDIDGKLTITKEISELSFKVNEYIMEMKKVLLLNSWSKADKDFLLKRCDRLINEIKNLEDMVTSTLWVSTREVATNPDKFIKQAKLFDIDSEK